MKNIKYIITAIYFTGIIFLPSFYWISASVPFEVPKVYLFNIWVGCLSILTAINLLRQKTTNLNKIGVLFIILFILWIFVCSLLGADVPKSFLGNYYRADGLITVINLALFSIVTAVNWQKKWFSNLIKFSTLGVYLVITETIINYFKAPEFVSANFGNPNFLGGFLLVSLPVTMQFWLVNKRKKYYLLAIILQIVCIVLTRSWSAIILSGLAVAGFIIISSTNRKRALIFSFLVSSLAVIILGLYTYQYLLNKNRFLSGYLPESRGRIFMKAMLAIKQKPLFGWGWANFDYAFDQIDWPMKYNHDLYVDKAHSSFFEVTTTTGIPGIIIYLTLILYCLKTLYVKKYKLLMLVSIIFLIHAQTNIISISEEIYFWLILGVTLKLDRLW